MCGGTTRCKLRANLTIVCVFSLILGTCHTKAYSNLAIHNSGDDATVRIHELQTFRNTVLEINFCGSTSKLHFTNVMLYDPKKNPADMTDVNRNYTGRITNVKMYNGTLSFLLLNVKFTDSGNFTVGKLSCEKVKTTILVARSKLLAQIDEPMILPFFCNSTSKSLINICKMRGSDCIIFASYNLAHNNCIVVVEDYKHRIESCVLNKTNFYLTIERLTWRDKGTYIAWDGTGLLLDSIFLDIEEKNTSSTEGTHGYFTSPFNRNFSSSIAETYRSEWLIGSSIVAFLVMVCLIITAVRKLHQSRGQESREEDIPCPVLSLKMSPASNNPVQGADAAEMDYEEPDINRTELTEYLEPIRTRTENTEYHNPGVTSIHSYEKLDPSANHDNNLYNCI